MFKNGTLYFAGFNFEPLGGSFEKVNKTKFGDKNEGN
jgi:hypothetical protein